MKTRNPLNRRIPREFIQDLGKYLTIFIFLVLTISVVSGFLIADYSVREIFDRSFSEKKVEDGHLSTNIELPAEVRDELEETGEITLYDYFYLEESLVLPEKDDLTSDSGSDEAHLEDSKTVRIYDASREVNLLSVHEGTLPEAEDEIALDRVFANNNGLAVGDQITVRGKKLTITGLTSTADYVALFQDNSDMVFNAINFCVAQMTADGMDALHSTNLTYNYAWTYDNPVDREDDIEKKERADKLLEDGAQIIEQYDEKIAEEYITEVEGLLEVTDFLPEYQNQSIHYAGDDMGGDEAMILVLYYIVMVILAFVFAVTISNTISSEAGVIGTLRASGYTRGELVRHYMVLPLLVSFIAAIIGNILSYTIIGEYFAGLYYHSYSLGLYEPRFTADAFIMTTVYPLIIMFVLNLVVLESKLRLSPLRFLRHDLSKRGKKKAFRLNTKISFLTRFRLRIIFQNIPNYLTMFIGIFFGGLIIVFGLMMTPMLQDLKSTIVEERLADYQYVLKNQVETEDEHAEKYAMTSLEYEDSNEITDEISVYGIIDESAYVNADISQTFAHSVLVSQAFCDKFSLSEGDVITLKDAYSTDTYEFTVSGVAPYQVSLAMYMPIEDYREIFDENNDYFTGYLSDVELTDLSEDDIYTVITASDLTKSADQMLNSMSGMMWIFAAFGVIIFVLLIFLLTKQIIEKNENSIALTKILGFQDTEISGLYLVSTAIVVILSLLVTIPLTDVALRFIFKEYIYRAMAGYIPYLVSYDNYVKMFSYGLISFIVVAVFQMWKIRRVPKSEALKNVE